MQGPNNLYFLLNASNQSYYVDSAMSVQLSGQLKPLEFSPDGWQDLSILTQKNKAYFGLDRTYGAPQGFVNDAARILKTIFYTKSIIEKVYLLILEQKLYFSATEYGYYYSTLVKCEIDLSQFDHEGPKVTEAILDADIAALIKANENTVYEIDLDVPDAVNILDDSIKLFATDNYKNLEVVLTGTAADPHVIPITFINKEGDSVNILNKSSTIDATIWNPFIVSAKGTNTGELAGSIKYSVNNLVQTVIMDLVKSTSTSGLTAIISHSHTFSGAGGSDEWDFDQVITLNEGEGLTFVVTVVATSPGARPSMSLNYSETDLKYKYNSRLSTALIKGLKPRYLWEQLTSKMTSGAYIGDSSFLDVFDPFVIFTSGDGLRQLPGSKIKTSMSEFFQFMNMRYCVGIGIVSGVLVIERKKFWCDTSNVISVGAISKAPKVTVANDYLFSNLKIGYPNALDNVALGNINGRYEFCMTHQYTSPNTRSTNTLDLTTKYNAGMYVITNTRLNSEGKTTTDGNSDNQTFVYHVKQDIVPSRTDTITLPFGGTITVTTPAYYELDRTINSFVTGLLDSASAFNVKLSPKYCLFENGSYIRSCLFDMADKEIVFASADKNVDMTTTPLDGPVISERGNVEISDLDMPMFLARIFEIVCKPPDTDLLKEPQRVFNFTYNNGFVSLGGFDIKTGTQPADNREQTFELLASPDSDLTTLIDVWD